MEHRPEPTRGAPLIPLEPQAPHVKIFRGRADRALTPVFGTSTPPRGLSGQLRAVAYRSPTWKARHWLTLMLADRVDALEHRLRRAPVGLFAALAGAFFLARSLKHQFN
jgi:hypothetical protein